MSSRPASPTPDSPWRQDAGYVGHPHPPYVTCWTGVDDVSEANGTIYVLPHSRAGTGDMRIIQHTRQEDSNDMLGYYGDDPGIPVEISAGSIAVFSSRTFHRGGANTTQYLRRAFVPQFSPHPILTKEGGKLWSMAVLFLKTGKITAAPAASRPVNEPV